MLIDNSLSGQIPAEIGKLTNLSWLRLDDNSLSGQIPAEIFTLTNLEILSLNKNRLSGTIPAEIGKLTNLRELHLSDISLSGRIPAEIGKLTNLERLNLGPNSLSGSIPAEIGKLTNLRELHLGDNSLSGTIPAEIGKLTNLTYLSLSGNSLSGSIPDEIGKLTNLELLRLDGNRLSGVIPTEIGDLVNLTHLYLNDNKLRLNVLPGSIPAVLSGLNLVELDISGNLFETPADDPPTPPPAGDGPLPPGGSLGPGESGDPPTPPPAVTGAGRFSDDDTSVHQANIEIIASRGITVGCDQAHPDRFCPDRTVTRAQMMAFLARALNEESSDPPTASRFTDVPADAWYLPHLERLADLGVAQADPDGAFRPTDPLTRADMAVLLTRAFDHITAIAQPTGVFEDVPADAAYAGEVEATFAAGVTRGCSTQPLRYCPDNTVTRAQMASFLARTLQNTP